MYYREIVQKELETNNFKNYKTYNEYKEYLINEFSEIEAKLIINRINLLLAESLK